MTDDAASYEEDLAIDEHALDSEWLDQPRHMFRYCRMLADAHREMDFAKEALAVRKAQLDLEIRSAPESFGITKLTEAALSAAVLMHEDYRAANKVFLTAQYNHEVVQGAVRSFDHRKSALENLVRLHGASYFAGPEVPHDLSEIRKQRDRRVQTRVRMKRGASR